ncbi:MoxR family ATPase [Hyalangium sp.]|uniref:AAA family ATPase n=1 Tax=Hyalangium sp. TaxID=2028555 RepID=UPI002D3F5620|nr:MoxR family ATPase [Hyalangium sp.]HYH95207.1 MoxR family ATPase [Hyalangium sp.]
MRMASAQSSPPPSAEQAEQARTLITRLLGNLEKAIRGKREALELVLCCVAAGGHVLLEDVPGTGKTTLAKALALSIGGQFKRVQFTPDLLPTDIVGTSLFNPQDGTFRFKAGPIFANVLIADEINRASPRTQSALLEGLSEQQVTVDGETRSLPSPFLCIATQNPVEFHGTYPLPEASLDRFAAQLSLGYPPEAEERALLTEQRGPKPAAPLEAVCSLEEVVALQRAVEEGVRMEASVADYLLRVVHSTRGHASVRLGVSTRGALLYARMARARALVSGRDFVLPEDLKVLAVPVLTHRLVLDTRARYAGTDKQALTRDIVSAVPLPR